MTLIGNLVKKHVNILGRQTGLANDRRSLLSGQEVGVCDKRWVFTA
jgi:hypothetical protein